MPTDLPARLAALRAATEAMTPGPWFTDDAPRFGGSVDANIDGLPRQVAMASGQAPAAERRSSPHLIMLANAAGIVALRNEALPLLDALLAEVQAARAEAVACREVAHAMGAFADELLDEMALSDEDGSLADDCARLAALRARLTTPDPAATQAALDEYTEAVMEACGAIDAERTPRTISARATVARLLGMPEVAR